jgi:hypothetical protein
MFGFDLEDVVKVGGGIVTGALGAKIASDIAKEVTGSDTLSSIAGIAGGVAAGDLGMDLVSSFFDDND